MTKERATESPRDSAGRRLNRRFRANRRRGRRRDRRKTRQATERDENGTNRPKTDQTVRNRPVCASEEPETRPPGRRLQRRRTPKSSWATQSTGPGSGVRSKRPTEKRPRGPTQVITTASTDAQISEWSANPRLSRSNFSFQRAPCSPHKLSRDHEASDTRKSDRHALHWTPIPLPRKFPFGKVANFTQRTPPGPL